MRFIFTVNFPNHTETLLYNRYGNCITSVVLKFMSNRTIQNFLRESSDVISGYPCLRTDPYIQYTQVSRRELKKKKALLKSCFFDYYKEV